MHCFAPCTTTFSRHFTSPVAASRITKPRLYSPPSRGAVRTPWQCHARNGRADDNAQPSCSDDNAEVLSKGPSGTLLGRILVETLALFTGVTLLLVLAVWKVLSVAAAYIWRGIMWLSVVRRLGHWVFGRIYALARLSVSQPRRLFELVGSSLGSALRSTREWTRNGPSTSSAHVNVRAERVVEHAPGVTDEVKHMREELVNLREAIERREKANGDAPAPAASATTTDAEPAAPPPPLPPRLILLRHAKSEWDRTGAVTDHERALSAAGVDEARRVGAELARRGWHFDSVLCSNARRTTETLAYLGGDAGEGKLASEPVYCEELYFALSGEEMATVVDDEARPGACKLVVAHAPGIAELVERLSGVKPDMGTACAALLEFGGGTPEDPRMLATGQWNLVDVVCPARLEPV